MDFRIMLAACVALTAVCRASHAQVDAARLQPGVDSLARYSRGETTPTETLSEELRIQQRDDGRRVVMVSQQLVVGREPSVDTLILAFDGLRPIAEWGSWYSIRYTEGRAVGWVRRQEDTTAVDVSLPSGTISAASFELVLRASDLHEGASFDMLGFFPRRFLIEYQTQPPSTVPLHARVTGVEDVRGAPCWVLDVQFGPLSLPVTIWIDQQTRQLRQRTVAVEPGSAYLYTAPLSGEEREQADRAARLANSTKWRPVLQDVLTILGELVRAHNREAGTAFQVDLPPLPANLYEREGPPYSGTVTFDDSTFWDVTIWRSFPAREAAPPGLFIQLRTRGRPDVLFEPQPDEDALVIRVFGSGVPASLLPRAIALPDRQEGLAAALQRLLEWQIQLLDEARPPD